MAAISISASQKMEPANYKKWPHTDLHSFYTTIRGGCEGKTIEEMYKKDARYVQLKSDQYLNADNEFVDVIKDTSSKTWLLIHYKDGRVSLFNRKFSLFRYRWQFIDELDVNSNDDLKLWTARASSFQLRNCLWFPIV